MLLKKFMVAGIQIAEPGLEELLPPLNANRMKLHHPAKKEKKKRKI